MNIAAVHMIHYSLLMGYSLKNSKHFLDSKIFNLNNLDKTTITSDDTSKINRVQGTIISYGSEGIPCPSLLPYVLFCTLFSVLSAYKF
jgi:hypothetical protein